MRTLLYLILAVILLISCLGCVWGWGHDGRGYDEHDRGGYGEHDQRGYDDRDHGGHGGDRHDDRRDIYDYR